MHLGLPELVILFVIALLLFGPKRLPGLARQAGKALGDVKRATSDVRSQVHDEVSSITGIKKDVVDTLNPFSSLSDSSKPSVKSSQPQQSSEAASETKKA
jgi:sec-independent protein translocase protein TatB